MFKVLSVLNYTRSFIDDLGLNLRNAELEL